MCFFIAHEAVGSASWAFLLPSTQAKIPEIRWFSKPCQVILPIRYFNLLYSLCTFSVKLKFSIVLYLVQKNENKTLFSSNLIGLRKERGLTQEDLSRISGISRRMVAYYETKPANPPINKVESLAKALNVRISELIGADTTINLQMNENFSNLDSRTIKKLKGILSLSNYERHMVYSFVDSLLEKKNKQK